MNLSEFLGLRVKVSESGDTKTVVRGINEEKYYLSTADGTYGKYVFTNLLSCFAFVTEVGYGYFSYRDGIRGLAVLTHVYQGHFSPKIAHAPHVTGISSELYTVLAVISALGAVLDFMVNIASVHPQNDAMKICRKSFPTDDAEAPAAPADDEHDAKDYAPDSDSGAQRETLLGRRGTATTSSFRDKAWKYGFEWLKWANFITGGLTSYITFYELPMAEGPGKDALIWGLGTTFALSAVAYYETLSGADVKEAFDGLIDTYKLLWNESKLLFVNQIFQTLPNVIYRTISFMGIIFQFLTEVCGVSQDKAKYTKFGMGLPSAGFVSLLTRGNVAPKRYLEGLSSDEEAAAPTSDGADSSSESAHAGARLLGQQHQQAGYSALVDGGAPAPRESSALTGKEKTQVVLRSGVLGLVRAATFASACKLIAIEFGSSDRAIFSTSSSSFIGGGLGLICLMSNIFAELTHAQNMKERNPGDAETPDGREHASLGYFDYFVGMKGVKEVSLFGSNAIRGVLMVYFAATLFPTAPAHLLGLFVTGLAVEVGTNEGRYKAGKMPEKRNSECTGLRQQTLGAEVISSLEDYNLARPSVRAQ